MSEHEDQLKDDSIQMIVDHLKRYGLDHECDFLLSNPDKVEEAKRRIEKEETEAAVQTVEDVVARPHTCVHTTGGAGHACTCDKNRNHARSASCGFTYNWHENQVEPVAEEPETVGGTNHSDEIAILRAQAVLIEAKMVQVHYTPEFNAALARLGADLLDLHDRTGISLDNWKDARFVIERMIGRPITENGV